MCAASQTREYREFASIRSDLEDTLSLLRKTPADGKSRLRLLRRLRLLINEADEVIRQQDSGPTGGSVQPEKAGLQTSSERTNSPSEWASHAAYIAQEMVYGGVPRNEILGVLVKAAEELAGDSAVCSLLVLDHEGLLRNAASPNLPADYLAAIDRLKPNPRVGTCAAAAATGSMVVTYDFQADDKWAELRHLPMALGFVGAWSMPIKASDGRVLGTLGTYFRKHRSPSPGEVKGVQILAAAAGLILDKDGIRITH